LGKVKKNVKGKWHKEVALTHWKAVQVLTALSIYSKDLTMNQSVFTCLKPRSSKDFRWKQNILSTLIMIESNTEENVLLYHALCYSACPKVTEGYIQMSTWHCYPDV
jgi:hypothetical protein